MVSLKQLPPKHYLQAFILFLVMMSIAFTTRWVSGKKMLFEVLWDPSALQLVYPGDRLEAAAIQQGKLALWNPYRGFGSTLLMPTGGQLAHLPKWLCWLSGGDNALETAILLRLVFAAFFTYLLARGVGLSHPAGLLAGNGFMFCGYFRQFVNFMDIDVVMSYPLATLFLLRFFRERKFFDCLFSLLSGYLVISGGHPESVYYLGAITLSIALFAWLEKSFTSSENPALGLLNSLFLAVFLILVWHISLCVTLPFWEMVRNGWVYHPEGMGRLHMDISHLIALLTPVFDPWLQLPERLSGNLAQFTLIPSYLGLVLVSLALLSVLDLHKLNPLACYFLIISLFLAGIFFGLPGFNLLSALPGVERLQNFRYPQPILALAVAMLAGFGFDRLAHPVSRKFYLGLLSGLGIWLICHLFSFRIFLLRSPLFLAAAILLLVFLAAVLFAYLRKPDLALLKPDFKSVIFAACALELFCYFVFASPFYGAEAFKLEKPSFLKNTTIEPEFFRFYSPDQKLIPPDTASLYGLRDVRERAPLYPKDYFLFLSALNQWKNEKEAVSDFLEDGKFYLPLRLDRIPENAQNLLFAYLALDRRLDSQGLAAKFQSGTLSAPRANYFSRSRFELNGKTREAFLLHPASKLTAQEKIGPGELAFELGMLAPENSRSDGADFLILGKIQNQSRLVFARFLPLPESRKRGWNDYHLQLPSPLRLALVTLPGPQAEFTQDFALFGSLRMATPNRDSQYMLLSDAGPFLYRRRFAVPRFFFPPHVFRVESKEQALALVRQGIFSAETVSLVAPDKTPDDFKAAASGSIGLTRDETDLVELSLETDTAGWLVMMDTYYPGWQARIDQIPARIYRANYLFRGLKVTAGKHTLQFVYRPVGLKMGLDMNLAFFLTAVISALRLTFRKRQTP